ncbi:MAG TPA: dihydrolipoyl dehydrogenase [Nitrososphaeraceae archaeon]
MYDAVVIGGGPGGYVCAIRAAQLGGNICLIEKDGLGGTCTQRGCIPTKYLHSVGDIIRGATSAKKNGINIKLDLDYKVLKSRMEATVSKLASGTKILLKSNGVHILEGEAHLVSANNVAVNDIMVETKNIVIATGSYPICLPGYDFGETILSTSSILQLEDLPKSITIIGGGYSGCEFASILNALGCKVSLIEAEDHLLPFQIQEIGNAIEKYMTLDGVNVLTKSKVEKVIGNTTFVNGEKLVAEKILVCIGRRPNINSNELNNVGIKFNQQGIIVNEKMRTNISTIYAIGDVIGMYELAHVASKQGEVAAENIMGIEENNNSRIDYQSLPVCVFTYPEVAFVGDLNGRSGEFPLAASAKANCLGEIKGVVKVFEQEGKLIGTYIIAPHAGEIIAEAALAIKMELNIKDIFNAIHAHPTLPESFAEALRDINRESIHLPARNRISKTAHP